MNILDSILKHQDGAAVQQLAQQFGIGNDQATSALSALIPQLSAGVQQNIQQPGGLQALLGALAAGQHEQYLNAPGTLGNPAAVSNGNSILGHLLGSRAASSQVAQAASQQTGLSSDLMKSMLPVVAALVMGSLARHASGAGAQASTMGLAPGSGSGMMGSLESMLDQNKDGSMVDDVMGMMGKFLAGRSQ